MASKITEKTISKLENQFETKTLTELIYVFLNNFKVKNTLDVNSFRQMKQFDTIIDPFFGRNSCQHKFSLSNAGFQRLFVNSFSN